MTTPPSWDTVYAPGAAPPPWDIGRPQPAFLRLADHGLLSGRLLDAGCGTGEHVLLAHARGAAVTGPDIPQRARARARPPRNRCRAAAHRRRRMWSTRPGAGRGRPSPPPA